MTLIPDEGRIGTTLSGKYLIERRLGAGAVGEVFRARNVLLAREVAIKFLRREHARNAELVDRFLREARAASCVQHPHVVDVLDVGTDGDTPYIVQELLLGEDLGAHLERKGGALPPRVAVALMLPAIDGVAAAHARGVVHRDLKPENVFLARSPDGVVPKVLDFGISKTPADSRATVAGSVFGTPGYMAPEQVMSFATADARADVWSLGVMLYELVSGRLPWDVTEPQALLVAVVTTAPRPLAEAAPECPPALCDVVERCLARDPAGRYPTAAELSTALRAMDEAPARVTRLQFVDVSLPPPPPTPSLVPSPPPRTSAAPMPLVRSRPSTARPARPSRAPRSPAPARPSMVAGDAPWELDLRAARATRREREITLDGRVSDIAEIRPPRRPARRLLPAVAAALVTAAVVVVAARGLAPHPRPAPERAPLHTTAAAPPVTPTPITTPPAAPRPAAPAVAAPTPAAQPTAPRAPSPRRPVAEPRHEEAAAPAAPEPAERVPAATPSELDASMHRAVARNMSQVVTCTERARMDDARVSGSFAVRLVIAPTGRVRSAEPVAAGPTLPLARCLARAMSSWSLDRSGGDVDATLTWPFDLAAR